ncbi:MAG: hypothetical protein ACFFAO_21825 [Candidatus Hermodarchaeota archaeon]
MCESKEKIPIIRVKETTDKAKYEFLRSYFTRWNQITKYNPRVIIDTHAGSGKVEYLKEKNVFGEKQIEDIYGSPLLAILKTLTISKDLTIILNEKNKERYDELKKYIDNFEENGIPIFQKKQDKYVYKSLKTGRKRKAQISKLERIFPEKFGLKPPKGYYLTREFTNAKIYLYNKDIEAIIDEIILKYLKIIEEDKNSIKPIALFFVDPCGMIGWNEVIEKICKRSKKKEGTELILNWSWEAIIRNLNTDYKNSVLSKIYGIPISKINEVFNEIEIIEFLNMYVKKLRKYFKFVEIIGVPRERRFKPRLSKHRKYFLLYCTNNESGRSLAGYKAQIIRERIIGFKDIRKFA